MATIESINRVRDNIYVTSSISEKENKTIKFHKNVLILPEEFEDSLTTGKLGNSNRIMLPKKILKRHDIELHGKVPARIFGIGNKKFLLIKLDEKKVGVPQFKE
ncbi:MAG: hypothetical protein KAT37_00650 [Candidatus Aenigmarchaeota archaeon]|nr:hypothetical protein [Candidatus Aenigmarchaeota archaeon]